ncbi:MAG: bifunctional oligoribonuclease/PAP phosphatase NrnA [Candidatus Omnitrophica bacterium]|nr:bifunctional oligoribonuclease/PAP phosphatase NrnA [Candidatus Omnitrophota bacterium]
MKKINEIIKKNSTFLISTHVNPDPDALCSELALAEYLRSLGKKVYVINESPVPKRFEFFPGARSIKDLSMIKMITYDVAFILDCGDLDRVGKVGALIDPNKMIVNVDHHITNTQFGSINLVKTDSSSTAELLFNFLKFAKSKFTKTLATNLYCGIMTDTGSFRYENTSTHTHSVVAELLKYKINISELYHRIYETIPQKDLKIFTQILNRFETHKDGVIICVELKKKLLEKIKGDFDLRDAVFKFLRSISHVEVIFILTEVKKNMTRINFRSSTYVDVAKIASIFDGGGHKRASGCVIHHKMSEAKSIVLKELNKAL